MAEDSEIEESLAESNLFTNQLQALISPTASSQSDANIYVPALEFISSVVSQREKEILESSDDDDLFYSIVIAVAAHRMGTLIDLCIGFADQALKTSEIILKYCLSRIHNTKSHAFFSKGTLVNMIEGICLGKGCLGGSEFVEISEKIESYKIPESLETIETEKKAFLLSSEMPTPALHFPFQILQQSQHSFSQGADWKDAFKLHCHQTVRNLDGGSTLLEYALCLPALTLFHCYFDEWGSATHSADICHINTKRIEALSEELALVNSIVTIPNVIAVKQEQLQWLCSLVCKCLKAAFYVAAGRYDVTVDDDSKSTGRRESNLEDSCRKFAWRATEMSLAVFKSALAVIDGSTRFGGGAHQNLQTIAVDVILNGFNFFLEENDRGSRDVESKSISVKWRWFSGLNIMLVTMASRIATLMLSLIEDLELENVPQDGSSVDKAHAINYLLISTQCSVWQRMQWLLARNNIPTKLWKLFCSAYSMARKITDMKQAQVHENEEDGGDESTESAGTSSGEDSGEEEDSVLGQWLETILQESTVSRHEAKKEKADEARSEVAYTQSLDIFVRLGSDILNLCTKFFPLCMKYKFGETLNGMFNENGIKSLAEMISEIDGSADELRTKEDIGFCFRSYVVMLYSFKVLDEEKLELLLTELGLSQDKERSEWPLYVSPTVLTLFGRLALTEQQLWLRNGHGSADTPRSTNAWRMLLKRLEKDHGDNETGAEKDINVEHLQLLASLFVNFSKECKIQLIRQCFDAIRNVSIERSDTYPLRAYRLMIILDYMLKAFSVVPHKLFEQLSRNVLNVTLKAEDVRQIDFVGSSFKAEDSFLSLVKRAKSSALQNTLLQQQPRFYELIDNDCSKLDSEVVSAIASDISSNNYKDLYSAFLTLSSSLLCFMDKNHALEERILQVVAARSCFQHIWKFLALLPPPVLLLREITTPEKILHSTALTLLFLKVMPKVFVNWKTEANLLAKKLFIYDELVTSEVLEITEKLLTECLNTQYICDLATNMSIEETDDEASGKVDWSKMLLTDALSCLLHLLFENVFSLNQEDEEEKERMAKLSWLALNNIISCHNRMKYAVITHHGEKPSKEVVEVYSKLLGISSSHVVKDSTEINFNKGLPEDIKDSSEKWKDILLTQFPSPKRFVAESSATENMDFTIYIDGLLAAHATVFVTGITFQEPAFTLKHLLKSSIDLMYTILKWLKSNSEKHFQLIQINVITAFVNLVTNSIVDYVSDAANQLLEITVGSSDGERLQEILHSHLLSLCFFVVDEEINRIESFLTSEETVLQCLGFIEKSLQRQDTPCSAANYFSSGYSLKLASILLSIRLSKFSKCYARKVLHIFSSLLSSPESAQQKSIRKAIVEIFNIDSSSLQEWLHCEVMSDSDDETITSHQAAAALQKFVNCAIEEKDVDKEYMLEATITLFERLMKARISSPLEAAAAPFAEIFDVLINVSSAVGAKGHLKLLQNVQNWIAQSRESIARNFNQVRENASSVDENLMKCIAVLLRYMDHVLSSMRKHCLKEHSSLTLQLSYSEAEYGCKDRPEPEADDDMNTDDEDSAGEESEEDSICNKLCTFTTTQRDFMNQHWYHCHTCKMNDNVGCCTICAKVCHKDHDVTYAKYGSFFCDCGAKEDGSCKSMTKRSPATGESASRNIPPSPFAAWESGKEVSEPRQRSLASTEVKPELKRGKSLEIKHSSESWHQDSSFIHLLGNLLKESKEDVLDILRSKTLLEDYMKLLKDIYAYKEHVEGHQKVTNGAFQSMEQSLESLYQGEKDIQTSDQLMIPILGSQEGAFESVRLNFSGEQGQTLRQLINAHVLRHSAMCLMASANGKRQHLAVTHEKGKITILQLAGLLKQPDTSSRKLTLSRLSSTTLPFTIVSIQSNPENEDALAVCGLKDCHVITYGHAGSVASHVALPLQLETGNFVIKAVWVPGEQMKIALLTADFVKVYDLSKSVNNPQYHYLLPGGKVRDATFINDGIAIHIAVMSSHGHIYTEVMNEATSAESDAFFLTNAVVVSHPSLKDSNGHVAGGGVSLYYSHVLKLMFFSYSQGKSFVGVVSKNFSEMDKVFNLSPVVASHAPLCHWHEITGQPGLLHCINQTSGNPVMVMVTPDKILLQELKGAPLKAKIQDAVCYYHSFPLTQNTDTTIQQKTTMVVLLEDGSLRIYNTHKDYTNYWLQNKFRPKAFLQLHPLPKKTKAARAATQSAPSNTTSFPIDFFEHCQPTNDIEFGGSDVLHVYNRQQVKHRLNTTGMYIASTKASGFKIEITNTNASNVMVGLRVQLGMRSLEKSPTYIEIFGRMIPLRLSRNRWFDIPFTKAESLTADKKMTITFGPSSDSSGINMIDSIKVFCKTKENFGWPEDVQESPGQPVDVQHPAAPSVHAVSESADTYGSSKSEPLLGELLETLNAHLLCFPIDEDSKVRQDLLDFATKLMITARSVKIQSQARTLMAALFGSKNDFFDWKDESQIKHALQQYKAATTGDKNTSGAPSVESIHELLNVTRNVGNVRPKNLIKALQEFDSEGDLLDNVMESFWKLYAMRPVTYILAPIEARAIGSLDGTIEALVEVLFAVLLGDSEKFNKLMSVIVKLLLSKDPKVSFAVKQGLSQAMQIRRKVSIVSERSPTQSDSPGVEDLNQDSRIKNEGTEIGAAAEQPTIDSDVQEINSFAEGVIEDLEPQQDGLQAFLGGDDAVMELALALSLQDQDNDNFDDDDADEEDDDDEADDDVDLEDDTDGPLPSERYDSLMQENQPLIGNAGARGPDANEMMEDGAITDENAGRERKTSRDSERSCPSLPKKKKVVEIIDTALEASWNEIFTFFIDHLKDLKSVNGIQAIPYLQVLLMLCSSLSDSEKDQQDLERVVSACLEILELDVKDFDDIAKRNSKREVQLVVIRFFSVLLSQSRSAKDLKADEETTKTVSKPGKAVAKILAEKGIVKYCLEFLESLLPYWRQMKATSNADAIEEDEVLLKPKPTQIPPDMSPFFLKQYVKSHANDLFEAFPQLVTEMILRMPYQIRKRLDSGDEIESTVFGSQWIYCLCEYMMATETPFIKRHVRKLLLVLCGSKEKYRHVKDLHTLKAHVGVIRDILQPGGNLSEAQTNLSYEETVRLADNCKACADIAMARVDNWQMFCKQEKGVLPFLVQGSYRLSSEHVSGIFLQLIGLALGSTSGKPSSGKADEKGEKGFSKGNLKALVGILFENCYSSLLLIFMKSFLLESNSTSLRWKAHELLHTVFRNISTEQRALLVELMWQLWSHVPFSGHKAAQFVDLLGYFTVKTPEVKEKMESYTATVFSLLSFSNNLLMNHPNASIYRRLQSLVEVNGFYLENDPCIVCNNPEIPFTHAKLTSIKSDLRYTTTAQLVKLNVNYTISRLLLRISDIKRAKMVKTINIYYNNKPVPSVVELKNKRNIWQKAKRITLTTDQTDVKVDFTLPIVAYNLMIEYADFYDNIQLSAESLQCPRCSASVPANPGVCANCGENVYQCHKCRAINYDERDPFLCTSCGFCKYAKFDFTLVTRPCCAVEPVNDETDRQSALNSVNNLLDSADKIYQQLSNHKQSLEFSLRGVSEEVSTSKASGTSSSGTSASNAIQVNKNIQTIAQKYCIDCKTSFEELSKIIQKVTATRNELSGYDQRQQEVLSTIVATSPGASPLPNRDSPFPEPSKSSEQSKRKEHAEVNKMGKCYGCALFTVEHCLTMLRAFATTKESHNWMLNQGLLHELLEHSLQHKKNQVTSLARKLIILITTDNVKATHELNGMIMKQVALSLESKAANVISDIFLQSQMSVLGLSLNTLDEHWNDRLRCVFSLFLNSMQSSTTDVLENVTLPCLKILANSIQKAAAAALDGKDEKESQRAPPRVNAVKWLEGDPKYALKCCKSKNPDPTREESIAEKYATIWLRKVGAGKRQQKLRDISSENWLRQLLFAPSSRAVRETVCGVLGNLCKVESKKEKMLQILTSYLESLHDAGENANDFFNLFKLLIKPPEWKRHLVACGILEKVTGLIVEEVEYLNSLENKTVGFDLSQGFALHALADILKMLFEDEVVKASNKSTYVGHVLQCYLSLRRLVVQRTKLIDAAQDILLSLLEELTTGTETEERAFMAVCISALKEYPISDIRTPVFIYERLCNIIHKEEKEVNEFFVIIEKDPQQEDFLQGRMSGNPYSSKAQGLGPLMRDVKNKICTECELVALLEDDTGMELLVNNKIISLDLPVADVYKKIWCAKGERPEAMKIVYRMRGLLGDATEDMVDNLDSDKDKDIDEEYEYRQAAVISEVGGLDIILKRLSYIRDLSRAQELISVMLKLLEYCVKVKVNRQYLGKHSVNSLNIMLSTLNLALRLEKEKGSGSGGAMIAERLLKIMGIVLHEASEQADQYQLSSLPGEESQLELLLGHITSPYVRANPNVLEAMMRLIPSLSFGSEQSMQTLINHFMPYLNFNSFDEERSANETLYLECFCVIANGISNTTSGSRLKDLMIDHGIPQSALEYLNQHTPPKSFSASGILDANRWKEVLVRPALPYVLRILTGLVGGHEATQKLVGTEEHIAMHHRLEQVSSEESVGSLAENLIEALRENPEVAKIVQAVRRQTREDKKKMALAMRQKQLEALGMVVTEGGQIKAKPSSVIKEMEELLEEKGLICCICREGYKFHPKKVLAVYTYTTRCVLEEFENKPRKSQGYSTVSHFNVIHVDCHNEAIRHARSRDEWESAALQNANTKCNGLMPIWGPKVSESAFATCLARHNNYLQECTGFHEPTFHSTVHDLKLLMLRFAQEKSFSDEAGGGGRISNIYLFPYTAHVALYVLNTARLHLTEEKIINAFLETPHDRWIDSAYEVDGPQFVTVLSLFTMSLESWKEKRVLFLRRLVALAHARSLSATPLKKWPDDDAPKEFSVYKSMLVFYELANQFHFMFKAKLAASATDWASAMSNYIRNNDEAILKAADKLLAFYENELLPCETFEEFLDVAGLLQDVEDPSSFLKETLAMVK